MKIITEGGIEYEVSDNYPEKPYTKRINIPVVVKRTVLKWDFVKKFSDQEWIDFTEAAKANAGLSLFQFYLGAATDILDMDDEKFTEGLSAVVAAGIITQEKADSILAG